MRLLSLFSGCGGMDIGFEGGFKCLKPCINFDLHKDWVIEDDGNWVKLSKTCFDTVFANDIRLDAKAAWIRYFSKYKEYENNIYYSESIVDLVKKAKLGEFEFPHNVDIVIGGFPCQDFSIAGKRLGFDSNKSHLGKRSASDVPTIENRGNLYMWMRDVVTISKPKMFVAENVKGLTNLSDAKDVIEYDFSMACDGGYLVVPARVLDASDYGVPQSRERVIFFGFKKSALSTEAFNSLSKDVVDAEFDPYPTITHGQTLTPKVTCREAFVDLDEPDKSNDESQQKYSKAKYLGTGKQGQTEVVLDSIGPTIRSEHHGNIEFRRLSVCHGGSNLEELRIGLPERRLTVRECARLQTFPDDYEFVFGKNGDNVGVSASSAYKIIGNAVPCVLAYNIAKNLELKWKLYFGDQ